MLVESRRIEFPEWTVTAIPDDRRSELDEVEDADLDYDLRREHVLAAWEKRELGAFVVPLGV
jgi:hypothetical protein